MLQLRPYQREAVNAVFDYWSSTAGNPLVVLGTGLGKSLSMATLMQELIEGWPDMRIVCATHVAELIEQSFIELLGAWPFAPAGIYSAGLGRRDAAAQIVFAGIQTVHNKAARIGHVDVLLIDEAHLVPPKASTMYGRFISQLREINPDMKIVGLTATPFRLDSGMLTDGDDSMFDDVVYEYGIGEGIADGYLAPLSSKATDAGFDLSGVGRLGGDYKQGALQTAVDKESVTREAVDEIVAKGSDRRSWLCFCSGVDHALHVRDEIRARGITCETVTGDTPKDDRRRILEEYKAYRLQCITNNSVLTTGFNHKGVDLIACLRPTLSASLYCQMLGRGSRPIYAANMPLDTVEERKAAILAGPKPNCLVLDFAKLVQTHGPVDMVRPRTPGSGNGEPPMKICPECDELLLISVMKCTCCGYEFPPNEEEKITAKADDTPVLSTEPPQWSTVNSRTFRFHPPKVEGNPPSVKVAYMVGMRSVNEWLCPQHMEHPNERSRRFPKSKADRYWKDHGGAMPFPKTVQEWLDRAGELLPTAEVQLSYARDHRYPDVKAHRAGAVPAADNDNDVGGGEGEWSGGRPAACGGGDEWAGRGRAGTEWAGTEWAETEWAEEDMIPF